MQEKVVGGENVASLKNVPISPSSICLKCRVTVALSKTAGAVIWVSGREVLFASYISQIHQL